MLPGDAFEAARAVLLPPVAWANQPPPTFRAALALWLAFGIALVMSVSIKSAIDALQSTR